jgi:hypothetical protein
LSGGLVGQHLWAASQRPGDRHPLLLAAGQLAGGSAAFVIILVIVLRRLYRWRASHVRRNCANPLASWEGSLVRTAFPGMTGRLRPDGVWTSRCWDIKYPGSISIPAITKWHSPVRGVKKVCTRHSYLDA